MADWDKLINPALDALEVMADWDKLMNPAREALEALIARGDEMADRLENLIAGAETVLEEWDRGDEQAFREAIEQMRSDVAAAKGERNE